MAVRGRDMELYLRRVFGLDDAILGNSIFANTGLGIDLDDDGVTLNDSVGHSDHQANHHQNFPALSSVSRSGA